MLIKLEINHQTITPASHDTIVANSKEYLAAEMTFSDDWAGTSKIAVITDTKGQNAIKVALPAGSNTITIPPQRIKAPGFKISVIGSKGDTIITTGPVTYAVKASGPTTGLTPTEEEKPLIAQIQQEIDNNAEAIDTLEENTKPYGFQIKNVTGEYQLEDGFIRKSDGGFTSSTDGKCTKQIETKEGDRWFVTGTAKYSTCLASTYGSDGSFIRSYGYNSDSSVTFWGKAFQITIKPDEKYIRFSTYAYGRKLKIEKFCPIETIAESVELDYKSNYLRGKVYVACGDSYTAGDFTGYTDANGKTGTESDAYDTKTGTYKTYPWWIAERNQMVLCNMAVCGSKITTNSGDGFSENLYKYIPKNADYITLSFGLNEINVAVGTKTDTTSATLWGAYNIVFEYILTNMPYAKVGVIIQDSWMTASHAKAIKEICEYWGVPYLDMKFDVNVPIGIGGRGGDITSAKAIELRNKAFRLSNSHPNLKAHEYRSTFIEDFLRRL